MFFFFDNVSHSLFSFKRKFVCVCVFGGKVSTFLIVGFVGNHNRQLWRHGAGFLCAGIRACVCVGVSGFPWRSGETSFFHHVCLCECCVHFRGELARNREYDGDDDYYYYYEMLLGWWSWWWWILDGARGLLLEEWLRVWERGGSRHICDNEREHHRREKLLTWDEVPASAAAAGRGREAHPADTRFSVPPFMGSVRFRLIAPPVKLVQLFFLGSPWLVLTSKQIIFHILKKVTKDCLLRPLLLLLLLFAVTATAIGFPFQHISLGERENAFEGLLHFCT